MNEQHVVCSVMMFFSESLEEFYERPVEFINKRVFRKNVIFEYLGKKM